MKVLVVTNGHGEDQLAVCLVDGLRAEWPELQIEAIPLVGRGDRLKAAGIAVDGPRVMMPSGGMVRPELATVWGDLRAGLLRKYWRQQQFVRSRKNDVNAVIAVGDVLAGWTAGRALPHLPLILVATAKSAYITGHSGPEIRWMRRRADHVFARDEKTAAALRAAGVRATWAGNLMMDAFTVTGKAFVDVQDADDSVRTVGLFPGSREDAYVNLRHLARVLAHLGGGETPSDGAKDRADGTERRTTDDRGVGGAPIDADDGSRTAATGRYIGLVPLAPGLDAEKAAATLQADGWRLSSPGPAPGGTGMEAEADTRELPIRRLRRANAGLLLVEGAFGDILTASEVVVGLAGTANEQAAGLGKPVVAFPGPGVQFGHRFLHAQKRLLGDALAVTDAEPGAVAEKVRRIFTDATLRERMAAAGRERMGPPGGSRRMARSIVRLWRTSGS